MTEIQEAQDTQTTAKLSDMQIIEIPLDLIEPDDNQPRKEFKVDELIESIKKDGQIQPILVTHIKDDKYKIVDGERRWQALTTLVEQAKANPEEVQTEPSSTIKAICVEGDNKLLGILGNVVRNNYNPMETAYALDLIQKELGRDVKDAEIAQRIGKSRQLVVDYNTIFKLPQKIKGNARNDSCVPFRRLIVLARDNSKTDKDKIAEYDKLYKKYDIKRTRDNQNRDSKKPLQTMDTRKVAAVRSKLEGMKSILNDVKFGEKLDVNEKSNFLKSLQEIIDTAQIALQRLSE